MKGLIDCNNFFVSCERIFNPRLRGIPVLVLTNNDGCISALSNEAKALGLKRGDPYFKIRDFCKANGVEVLSGNHRLYGDISSRVMATISSIIPHIQIYSIDEAFIDIDDDASPGQAEALAREIVRRVRRDVGIPTALGIAPTDTLAKISASFAKNYPAYHAVCQMRTDSQRRKALALTPLGKVWGIGRRLDKRLSRYGMSTALDLADRCEDDVRQLLNATGLNTWKELNGIPSIIPDRHPSDRRQMCCSRTFASDLHDPASLSDVFGYFASLLGKRLRAHGCAAPGVTAFLHTNSHRPDLPQYCNSAYRPLEQPSDDTSAIARAASEALKAIFRKGYGYKRAGLIVSELCPKEHAQPSLFVDAAYSARREILMRTIDRINAEYHHEDTVRIASAMPPDSVCRCDRRSPDYTTRIKDIININTSANGL